MLSIKITQKAESKPRQIKMGASGNTLSGKAAQRNARIVRMSQLLDL